MANKKETDEFSKRYTQETSLEMMLMLISSDTIVLDEASKLFMTLLVNEVRRQRKIMLEQDMLILELENLKTFH